MFMVLYLFQVKPFEIPVLNLIELYNETIVLLGSSVLLIFSDYMNQVNSKDAISTI